MTYVIWCEEHLLNGVDFWRLEDWWKEIEKLTGCFAKE
jgi:hypothetical protein